MQTFLPQIDYYVSAKILDSKRLNKQILEGYQILNVLSGKSKTGGWRNHPAVLMWKGYEHGLWNYIDAMVYEAKYRGIKTENNERNLNNLKDLCWEDWGNEVPHYFQNNNILIKIVTTHRANLFKKDPLFYAPFQYAVTSINNAPCCPDRKEPCKYYWPTHNL